MLQISNYDQDFVDEAIAMGKLRWELLQREEGRARVATGRFENGRWARIADLEDGEDERVGIFDNRRLWVADSKFFDDGLERRLAEVGAVAIVSPNHGKDLGRVRQYGSDLKSDDQEQRYLDHFVTGSGGRSAASFAAEAKWTLFDIPPITENERSFELFDILNEFPDSVEPSPLYTLSWGVAPWDLSAFHPPLKGNASDAFTENGGSEDVTLLVSDSGLVANVLATAKLLSDEVRGIPNDADDALLGLTIADGGGHGTFVAGVAQQLAPKVKIVVSNVCTLTAPHVVGVDQMFSDLISALDVHTGRVIVNWSLSSHPGEAVPRHFDGILTAILDAYPELIVVAAAGNDDSNNPKIRPGGFAHSRFISVGATRQEEHWPNGVPVKAIFSNYGHWVQCWTIGENIVAPYLNGTVSYFDAAGAPKVEVFDQSPSYAKWSGTSFAAPIVAAKIAVEYSKTWMTAEAAIDAVLSSAQRVVLGNRANSAFVDPR